MILENIIKLHGKPPKSMSIKLKSAKSVKEKDHLVVLLSEGKNAESYLSSDAERKYLQLKIKEKKDVNYYNKKNCYTCGNMFMFITIVGNFLKSLYLSPPTTP